MTMVAFRDVARLLHKEHFMSVWVDSFIIEGIISLVGVSGRNYEYYNKIIKIKMKTKMTSGSIINYKLLK